MGGGFVDTLKKIALPLWRKIKSGIGSDTDQAIIGKVADIGKVVGKSTVTQLIDKIPGNVRHVPSPDLQRRLFVL